MTFLSNNYSWFDLAHRAGSPKHGNEQRRSFPRRHNTSETREAIFKKLLFTESDLLDIVN